MSQKSMMDDILHKTQTMLQTYIWSRVESDGNIKLSLIMQGSYFWLYAKSAAWVYGEISKCTGVFKCFVILTKQEYLADVMYDTVGPDSLNGG